MRRTQWYMVLAVAAVFALAVLLRFAANNTIGDAFSMLGLVSLWLWFVGMGVLAVDKYASD